MNTPEEAFDALNEEGIVKGMLREFSDLLDNTVIDHLDYVDDDEDNADIRNEDRYVELSLLILREFRRQFFPVETWGEFGDIRFDTHGIDMNSPE